MIVFAVESTNSFEIINCLNNGLVPKDEPMENSTAKMLVVISDFIAAGLIKIYSTKQR